MLLVVINKLKSSASSTPRGTNRGAPNLKQQDPVDTISRVRKATPENHGKKKQFKTIKHNNLFLNDYMRKYLLIFIAINKFYL